MPYWLKWGYAGFPLPHLQAHTHPLLFARQYASRAAFPQAETVSLIRNFKIPAKATPEQLAQKQSAIKRFANELVQLLKKQVAWYLTWIPPSLPKGAAGYDDRLEQVARLVAARCPGIKMHEFFVRTAATGPLHKSRGIREPNAIRADWNFTPPNGFIPGVDRILVLDDVVTTGASMRAAFDIIQSALGESTQVMGIAWAMTRADYPSLKPVSATDSQEAAVEAMRVFEEMVKSPDSKFMGKALLSRVNAYVLVPAGIETIDPDMPLDEAKEWMATHILHWKESVWQAGANAAREEAFAAGSRQGYDQALDEVAKGLH